MGQTKRESTAPIEEQTSRKRRRTIAPSDENVPRPFEIKGVPNTNDAKNVRVVARIRPLSKREEDQQMVLKAKGASIVMDNGDDRKFDYDAVFGPTSTQWDVYHQSGARDAVCGDILQGFNCTILAYGQTGSGKTCKHSILRESGDVTRSLLTHNLASMYQLQWGLRPPVVLRAATMPL